MTGRRGHGDGQAARRQEPAHPPNGANEDHPSRAQQTRRGSRASFPDVADEERQGRQAHGRPYKTVEKPGLAGGRLFRRPSASGAQARSGTRATKSEGATASQAQRPSGGATPGRAAQGPEAARAAAPPGRRRVAPRRVDCADKRARWPTSMARITTRAAGPGSFGPADPAQPRAAAALLSTSRELAACTAALPPTHGGGAAPRNTDG